MMKTPSIHPRLFYFLFTLAFLLPPAALPAQSPEDPKQAHSEDAADLAACKAKLNKVYQAFRAYRVKHGELPDWLSDLHPEFIGSPQAFVCPFVMRQGDLESWRDGMHKAVFEDPVLPNSYSYEFCANDYQLWCGKVTTVQEFKKRQMERVGEKIPIIRCFAHRPVLNLSYGGEFYPSGSEWEEKCLHADLTIWDILPAALFKDLAPQAGEHPDVPPRPKGLPETQIDLSPHYHVPLDQPWLFRNPTGCHLASFAREHAAGRLRTVVPFDARGVMQLKSTNLYAPFPVRMTDIKVGQKVVALHFLVGAVGRPDQGVGTRIGAFIMHLESGAAEVRPIRYGHDLIGWLQDPEELPEVQPSVAWTGDSYYATRLGKKMRLYQMSWQNPRPEERVASITFESTVTKSAPFLLGITVEPPGPDASRPEDLTPSKERSPTAP